MSNNRLHKGFYLNEWNPNADNDCDDCKLTDECNKLSNEFGIDHFMCQSTEDIKKHK